LCECFRWSKLARIKAAAHGNYQLNGKLAFITAGANGIGAAIADLLTDEGAHVFVADQDGTGLNERGSRWSGKHTGDLATADGMATSVEAMLQAFGRAPDILINNLGVADPIPFEDLSDDQWIHSMNINLMGAVRTCRSLFPRMRDLGPPPW
jgi:NAD(P)-dependent dehydrogenase (short-subunit alcohol dehydrogenase family)